MTEVSSSSFKRERIRPISPLGRVSIHDMIPDPSPAAIYSRILIQASLISKTSSSISALLPSYAIRPNGGRTCRMRTNSHVQFKHEHDTDRKNHTDGLSRLTQFAQRNYGKCKRDPLQGDQAISLPDPTVILRFKPLARACAQPSGQSKHRFPHPSDETKDLQSCRFHALPWPLLPQAYRQWTPLPQSSIRFPPARRP
ncbi:MAG: hypothetical protein BWY82_01436 [Verrucomicrobia bacterium ADurb.Bin474]|nr:MAG: hypothetical protein BWY82_01436 [Verrucomicrobia bacterium ADurb.Bin474]